MGLAALAWNPLVAFMLWKDSTFHANYFLDAIVLMPSGFCLGMILGAWGKLRNTGLPLWARGLQVIAFGVATLGGSALAIGLWKGIWLLGAGLTNFLGLRFLWEWRKSRSKSEWVQRIAAAAIILWLLYWMAEMVMSFVPISHRFNGTLGSKVWHDYYWHVNSGGFRERAIQRDPSKRFLAFLGDSFTAGHGIKNPDNRFSEILAAKLPNWEVYNYGVPGATLCDQQDIMKLDIPSGSRIIYAWFPNDIDCHCQTAENPIPVAIPYQDLPSPLRFWVRRSYLLNFIYWRFPHPSELGDYNDWLKDCYGQPKVFSDHLTTFQRMDELAKSTGTEWEVLLLPYMEDLHASDFAVEPVLKGLQDLGIKVHDPRPVLERIPAKERVVNGHDAHASKVVHKALGEWLLQHWQD